MVPGALGEPGPLNKRANRVIAAATVLACAATAALFALYPQLAVRDADGFAYIMGARGLHDGIGYRSLVGEPLNHWPPGYSLILSPFRDNLLAAKIINYCSFGAAAGLIYGLLRGSSWSWQAALGLTLVLTSGFLRLLANSAHADILTYAIFLIGIVAASQSKSSQLASAAIWAFLIPIKLISVVFLPPAAGADFLTGRRRLSGLVTAYAAGVIVTVLAVVGVLLFNITTTRTWVSPSYGEVTLTGLVDEARSFVFSIPREFFFSWHGSILEPVPFAAFLVCMALAVACLISLRPEPTHRWFLIYGLLCLLCSALLLCVKPYIPTVRLVGYGLIVLFLGFRPIKRADLVWLVYGFVSLGIGVVNALTVSSLGSMDPHYADLAKQVAASVKPGEVIATNSFYILDLNANVASVPISNLEDATSYKRLLWVTLPNYDPGSAAITPLSRPGTGWCEQQQFTGAILFQRCDNASG